jgi:hypothetical protein
MSNAVNQLPIARLILMLIVATSGIGCAGPEPVTLDAWQHAVERYVWDHGNGDPTVLRDASWDDSHHGFALLGDALPESSTDAYGLLLGHRIIGLRPWFLFLFTIVDHRHIREARAVGLCVEGGNFVWAVGKNETVALQRFSTYEVGHAKPPEEPFPAPGDKFSLKVTGDVATIEHLQTRAHWHLRLSAGKAREQGLMER